jgi:hypothetical protein
MLATCHTPLWLAPARAADSPPQPVQPAQPILAANLRAFSTAAATPTAGQPPPPWRAVGLPKGKAPLTRMDITLLDGERVLRLATDKSYGTLSHALPDVALSPQATLRWKWRLDAGLPAADLRRKDGDDAPLRVCALFDLPLDNLGLVERTVMRMARSASGEALPAATLCYVWDHHLPTGTLLPNPYTKRVRFMVLNSGDGLLGTWVTHERRLAADFLRAFKDDLGNGSGTGNGNGPVNGPVNSPVNGTVRTDSAGTGTARVPPLVAIVLGADSDNTGGTSLAYIGDVVLKP